MPCSCKKNSAPKVAAIQPSTGASKYVSTPIVVPQEIFSDSYSFGATTTPEDLCLNCISKHLGLAWHFLDQDSPDNLIAAGQLLCAAQHCKNHQLPSYRSFSNLALKILRNPKDAKLKEELAKHLQNLYLNRHLPQQEQLSADRTQLQIFIMQLLFAYSLVFVQLLYQKVNIPWAVSNIAFFTFHYVRFKKDRKTYQEMRRIWKMLQDMQPQDDTYLKAREEFWGFILQYYKLYKEQAVVEK